MTVTLAVGARHDPPLAGVADDEVGIVQRDAGDPDKVVCPRPVDIRSVVGDAEIDQDGVIPRRRLRPCRRPAPVSMLSLPHPPCRRSFPLPPSSVRPVTAVQRVVVPCRRSAGHCRRHPAAVVADQPTSVSSPLPPITVSSPQSAKTLQAAARIDVVVEGNTDFDASLVIVSLPSPPKIVSARPRTPDQVSPPPPGDAVVSASAVDAVGADPPVIVSLPAPPGLVRAAVVGDDVVIVAAPRSCRCRCRR